MKINYIHIVSILLLVSIVSCTIDPVENPNGPTQESYANDATLPQLQLLATGLIANLRNDMEFYYQTVSIVGREYYDLNGTDPRYTGELLGAGDGAGVLDNNGFLTTRSFTARYRNVRIAENLITAVTNSAAGLDDAGKNGFLALANMAKAHELLLVANRQFQNGIRVDVSDPDNLGPFLSYNESLSGIKDLLNTAISQANSAGATFTFNLSSGFSGFDTPDAFAKFLYALLARVELYDGNKSGAATALDNSFLDFSAGIDLGTYHVFSASGNDQLNPIFYALGQNNYMAHPSFTTDIAAADTRIDKVTQVAEPVSIDELSSDLHVQVYTANVEPVAIIRNEELMLIRAETQIGTDNAGAVASLNAVRMVHGLSDYTGGMDATALEEELLYNRRYSLFGEGHRWIDMRRYGRLNQLPLDRAGDEVFTQFPRPILEQ